MAGDSASDAIICEKPNSCLRNLVLKLLQHVMVLWRCFLQPMGSLPDLGKGLDYTVLWGMLKLLVERGTLLSNMVRNLRR